MRWSETVRCEEATSYPRDSVVLGQIDRRLGAVEGVVCQNLRQDELEGLLSVSLLLIIIVVVVPVASLDVVLVQVGNRWVGS